MIAYALRMVIDKKERWEVVQN